MARAFALDPANTIVARWLLRHGTVAEDRWRAASALFDSSIGSIDDRVAALTELLDQAVRPLIRVEFRGDRLLGTVFWRGDDAPNLTMRTAEGNVPSRLSLLSKSWCPSSVARVAEFVTRLDRSQAMEITASIDGVEPTILGLFPRKAEGNRTKDLVPGRQSSGHIDIVVPLYRDIASAEICLAALFRQTDVSFHVWLVDDHSPEPGVSELGRRYGAYANATLIVNAINHGFAASVNKALARIGEGDVLLLNSDVVLPDGALRRLRRAAHSDPSIGTAMPMSNDSEMSSFPNPGRPNAPLAAPLAAQADRFAFEANGHSVVEIGNAIGFCVYVTEACRSAVGELSYRYGRGYYEDVELCLKAFEHGFLNVAATGVYVTHHSGRSFQTMRSAWVSRNIAILESRFPTYRERCFAFVRADPLRAARSAIEERMTWASPSVLLVSRHAFDDLILCDRAERLTAEGQAVVLMSCSASEVSLRAFPEGPPPFSLHFAMTDDGLDRLSAYLSVAPMTGIEMLNDDLVADVVRQRLQRCGVPLKLPMGSGKASARRPNVFRRATIHCPVVRRTRARVGIVVPRPAITVDKLLIALGRHFAMRGPTNFVVLGQCIDDDQVMAAGTIHVTGPITRGDHASVVGDYGLDAMFSPYRDRMSVVLDELGLETKLDRGYFDGSEDGLLIPPDDLVLGSTLPDSDVCSALFQWCNP